MARKFLYFVAFCIVLAIAAGIAMAFWSKELTELAFVPRADFEEQDALTLSAYEDPDMWLSRPGMGSSDPARFLPEGYVDDGAPSPAAVFFIHPTSFVGTDRWNARLDDPQARQGAELFVRALASPFNRSVDLWAPAYRQAAVGSFMTEKPEGQRAIQLAYRDVRDAFDYFVESIDADTPIVLAGHSQGALHLMRLMSERVAGTPLASRVVAVYPIGWPVSTTNDLPEMGLPACATPDQAGCVMSWSTFAEPAEPDDILDAFATATGLNGQRNAGTAILCSNPLTGGIGGAAPPTANRGTLVPNEALTGGRLVGGVVGARCDDRGLLLINEPPPMGSAVLPGNNYHVYDIPLFWANLREDVTRRTRAFTGGAPVPGSPPAGPAGNTPLDADGNPIPAPPPLPLPKPRPPAA